jgi:hypothetical protein
MEWTFSHVSTVGSSHLSNDIPCQDTSIATRVITHKGEYIILAASDGCGTAKYSDLGSQLIISELTECLAYWIARPKLLPSLLDIIDFAFGHVHKKLVSKASLENISISQLAATCLCIVIGPGEFAAAQIGDGVIVGATNDVYGCLFWPSQEYANVTHSLTDKEWYKHVQKVSHHSNLALPNAWFLATDGIQSISCDYQKRVPHVGFVSGLIRRLRSLPSESETLMTESLDKFFRSDKINTAVSDDKTVVLACK